MASLKNLLRDKMAIWRSANGIILLAGRNGRIPPTHIVQLLDILPNDKCRYSRAGHGWVNPLYLWDNDQKYRRNDLSIDDMCEFQSDASSLED
eukprot:2456083-Pyramimonas_sp.AAC.1